MIAIGRNRADLRDHVSRDRLRHFLDLRSCALDCFIDATLQGHRVCTRGHGLHAFAENRLREHGRGGCAVAGNVAGLRGHFAHHLRAHVLHCIFEFDLFRHGHTVFGDRRAAVLLIENDVASLWTERDFHCVGELINAAQNCRA